MLLQATHILSIHDNDWFAKKIWTKIENILVQLQLTLMATANNFDNNFVTGLATDKYFSFKFIAAYQWHSWYLRGWRVFPMCLPKVVPQRLVDAKLQEIKALETPPPTSVCAHRPQWMSADSICLIYSRSVLCRWPDHNRNQYHILMRSFQKSLSTDSYCWVC